MKIETTVKVETDVRYFCADILPRYYEDAEVDGVEDISYDEQKTGAQPRMPLVVKNEACGKGRPDESWLWKIKIDLESGKVLDWPAGTKASVHYKVCDQGVYWLEDENGNVFHKIESYVPDIIDIDCDGYGDYVLMNIGEDGTIEDWWAPDVLKVKIEDFLEDKGF